MRLLVASTSAPRSHAEIRLSFIYDEISRLAKRGIEVHVARYKTEGFGRYDEIYFCDITRFTELSLITQLFPLFKEYPLISLIRGPRGLRSLYAELHYAFHIAKILTKIMPDILTHISRIQKAGPHT